MGSGVLKQHVCWWAGLYFHLASCLAGGILVLVPAGWWGLWVDPNANKLGKGFQNGTCQRQYPRGRKSTPKMTVASVWVPRMSSSCFLPLWEASWGQQAICVCECVCAQPRPTLSNPMDCSPPGSSEHGIFQTRILEWVDIASSRGSSWPRDQTHISCLAGWFFTTEPPGKPGVMIRPCFPMWLRFKKVN